MQGLEKNLTPKANLEQPGLSENEEHYNKNTYKGFYYEEGDPHPKELLIHPKIVVGHGNLCKATLVTIDTAGGDLKEDYYIEKSMHQTDTPPSYYTSHLGIYPESKIASQYRLEHTSKYFGREQKNHKELTELGLKTLKTTKLIYTNTEYKLLTSSGFTKNQIALGDKGEARYLKTFGIPEITTQSSIKNLREVTYQIKEHAVIAAQKGIYIDSDLYLLMFNPKTMTLDFVLSDLGNIRKGVNTNGEIEKYNIEHANKRIGMFLSDNVIN